MEEKAPRPGIKAKSQIQSS
ncbi:uncharacterized protein G2W53_010681 [Senna tora]|uniref:Uncharacterized protein n=1 Tax=Senna tora TaxID=362788 RepID=A0A834X042_9FABA|nr:uncharacterized protein G2W53_010681 [Senna tora]